MWRSRGQWHGQRQRRQRQLAADVEHDVGLAARHGGGVGRADRLVVEVEPLLLVDRECCVVARTGAGAVMHDDGGEVVEVVPLPRAARVGHVAQHEAGHVQRAERE